MNILYSDQELDSIARILKAMANEVKALTPNYRSETVRWLAISRTELQRAGMWLGKMRMIAKTSEYPYPESTKPQTGEKIAKPIHDPNERPDFQDGLVQFKDNVSFSYPGVTTWTHVERIKAMRDIIGSQIELMQYHCMAALSSEANVESPADHTMVRGYAWEGLMLLEHSRHALGMVLGGIHDSAKEMEQLRSAVKDAGGDLGSPLTPSLQRSVLQSPDAPDQEKQD